MPCFNNFTRVALSSGILCPFSISNIATTNTLRPLLFLKAGSLPVFFKFHLQYDLLLICIYRVYSFQKLVKIHSTASFKM